MTGIFSTILSLSLSGSLLIAALLLFRPVYRHRLSRRWQYYIWLVVIARLLLPFAPERNLINTLFQHTEWAALPDSAPLESEAFPLPAETPPYPAAPLPEAGGLSSQGSGLPVSGTPAHVPLSGWAALSLLWLATALTLLMRKIILHRQFAAALRAGGQAVSSRELYGTLEQISAQHGISRPVKLYCSPRCASPLLLGFFKPCIFLPSVDLPEDELRLTLLHELIHLKRCDPAYKWLTQLTICLHWFNPLVRRMAREIDRACELACDEAVLRELDFEGRLTYGDTLVHAMCAGRERQRCSVSVPLSESAELLKERLESIMRFSKKPRRAAAVSLSLTVLLLVGAAAMGAWRGTPVKADISAKADTSITTGASAKSDIPVLTAGPDTDDAAHYYTREGFCQSPYLFDLAWNAQEDAVKDFQSTMLSLADGRTLRVWFSDGCADTMREPEAQTALSALLSQLQTREFPPLRPLVVSIEPVGDTAPVSLAEQYYREERLVPFYAVFPLLDQAAQEGWLERCYSDEKTAFFAAGLDHLSETSSLPEQLAERAYLDGRNDYFAIVTGHMDESALRRWLHRADQDRKTSFYTQLLSELEDFRTLNAYKAELDARRLESYAEYGITQSGSTLYYRGDPIRVFLDLQEEDYIQRTVTVSMDSDDPGRGIPQTIEENHVHQDKSVITLDLNPEGTVDVKVTRDFAAYIISVDYMDEAEAAEYRKLLEETAKDLPVTKNQAKP